MSFADVGKVPRAHSVPHAKHSALTVFTGGKVESSPQLRVQEMQHASQQPPADLRPEKITEQCRTWLVRAKENITVAPKCRQVVLERIECEKEQILPLLICVEPAQIPRKGALSNQAERPRTPGEVATQW